ncbi:MAG: hypothetical protein HYT43_01965 [Candidatus Taylorbacteria bacterium]|nr:hypothetical protein [Candidatus Taylorbacteria bacterium]
MKIVKPILVVLLISAMFPLFAFLVSDFIRPGSATIEQALTLAKLSFLCALGWWLEFKWGVLRAPLKSKNWTLVVFASAVLWTLVFIIETAAAVWRTKVVFGHDL